MKKIIVALVIFICILNLKSQWFVINHQQYISYSIIDFVNIYTGWVITPVTIRKSTDSGNNWTVQVYPPSGVFPRSLYMLNENFGWIGCQSGYHYRTTNGGNNWLLGNINEEFHFDDIFFIDNLTGWAVGWGFTNYVVIKSTNGGLNWLPQILEFSNGYQSVFFKDNMTGWIAGSDGRVMKTTNGGANWISQVTGTNQNLHTIFFVDYEIGWFGGNYSLVCKTTNGGINWNAQNIGGSLYGVADLFFINSQTGWGVGGYARIIKTSNGGNNWNEQFIRTYDDALYSVDFISEYGWAAGNDYMLKTKNGGNFVGLENRSNEKPNSFSLHQNYPNPFNPTTKIRFDIPPSPRGEGQRVRVIIYDILGREVTTLVNESIKPGTYEVDFDGSSFASGVYFYALITNEYIETKRMVLIK